MKSDLFTLLSKLTVKENKNFGVFLKNEYLSHNKKCYYFFRELLNYYPLYRIEQEEIETIYRKLYEEKSFHESTFRSLVRSLLISLEDFLVIENLKKNKVEREFKLSKIYYDLNVYGVTVKKMDELKTTLKNLKEGDLSGHFLRLYDYEILNYNLFDTKQKILHKSESDYSFHIIQNANNYMSLYYFIETVSNFVNYKIQQHMYDKHSGALLENLSAPELKRFDLMFKNTDHEYAYLLYKKLYILYSEKADKNIFLDYKTMLFMCSEHLSQKELLNHYNNLITFCIIHKAYIPELADGLWSLYEFYLSKELYISDSSHYLDTYLFRSIVFHGLRLGYYSEVKDIIEKHSYNLNPDDTTNMKYLGNSYLLYYTGNLQKAKEQAEKVKLNDYVFKYDIKNLLIKIYFEEGSFEQLNSTIKCYKEYLRNDEILNEEIKLSFKNFLYYTEHLAKEIDTENTQELNYLLDKLNKHDNVYSKDWLSKMYRSVGMKEAYANN